MPNYVFSLGLIPVQEWISEARRSRDLRAGSVFLSFTMAKVLSYLENAGAEVWLPCPPEGTTFETLGASFPAALEATYGVPNRASGSIEYPAALGRLQEEVVLPAWRDFTSHLEDDRHGDSGAFWGLVGSPPGEIDCPVTVVWVAEPLKPEDQGKELDEDLQRKYLKSIDRLYAHVKRTRPLRPWSPGGPVGKCNQCGRREAAGPNGSFSKWRSTWRQVDALRWVQKGTRVDPGERLCWVCLAKRFAAYAGGQEHRFPSTGEIAAGPWRRQVESHDKLAPLFRAVQAAVKDGDLGRALYAADADLEEKPREARAALRRGIESLRGGKEKLALAPRPPNYLALLTFDGDDMGRHVQEDPKQLPGQLAAFAALASMVLKDHAAEAFYLGGDEGLAMAPAEKALPLAFALRDAFREIVGPPRTLSLGLAFFEQSRPMQGAIEAARAALRQAKDLDGKNGLGVAVETASGNRWGTTAKWGEQDGREWERTRALVELVQDGTLSSGWAYDMERFLETLEGAEWGGQLAAAVRAEAQRLLFRRLQPKDRPAQEKRAWKHRTWNRLAGDSWWADEEPDPERFHLVGFLARQRAQESPTAEAEPAEEDRV
jgi:CRISPR-associated protein Cmr2